MNFEFLNTLIVSAIEKPMDTRFLTTIYDKLTNPEIWINILERVVWSIGFIIIGLIVMKVVKTLIQNFFTMKARSKLKIKGSAKRNKTLINVLQNMTTIVVWFVVVVTVLETFNIPVGTLLAGAGIVGLAIGFGAQSLVKDMITGFFIILENQFDTGDFIRANTTGTTVAEGEVIYLGLRSSKIKGYNGEVYMIPNGTINEVVNFSVENSIAFLDLNLSLETDTAEVERLLTKYFDIEWSNDPSLVAQPAVLGIQDFQQGQAMLRIQFITEPMEQFGVLRKYRGKIKDYLNAHEIELAVPVMDFGKDTSMKGS